MWIQPETHPVLWRFISLVATILLYPRFVLNSISVRHPSKHSIRDIKDFLRLASRSQLKNGTW